MPRQKISLSLSSSEFEEVGHLKLKRCEAACVLTEALAVEPDDALVVDAVEMEEITFAGLGIGVETLAVPDRALIIVEVGRLSVPVTGDVETAVRVEIVLLERGEVCTVAVLCVAVVVGLQTVVEVSHLVRIDDSFPGAVKRDLRAAGDILYESGSSVGLRLRCG